jgi:uncharacterized lipoprotein YajG
MKNILKLLVCLAVTAVLFTSCKKQISEVTYLGGTKPVLTANNLNTVVLLKANENNAWNTLSWTNPDYQFSTGNSSQDVTYTIQVDTTGSNFTNPKISEIVVAKELSRALTVKDINAALLGLDLKENIAHNVEIRVKTTLTNANAALYSNVLKIVLTPYLDVVYPVPPALYITGSATPLNWQCACATDGTGSTQKFTKVGSSSFELTIALSGGNSYLFITNYASWNDSPGYPATGFPGKYGFDGSNNTNNVNGDKFKPGGGDMLAPATGTYKITVDFKTGKWTVQ